ncbi:MAG: nitroreductase family protein [Candidatus Heimdallarchaeota archaeon]
MEFETVIKERFSCRSFFTGKHVSDDKLQDVIRLSQRAPSAGNLQAGRLILVKNSRLRQQLARAALDQDFLNQAPIVIVVSAAPSISSPRYHERGRTLYALQDATIIAAYLQLACTNVGLASVWVGAFSEHEVINILKPHVPAQFIERPIALIAIGYSAEDKPIPSRRIPIDQLVVSVD